MKVRQVIKKELDVTGLGNKIKKCRKQRKISAAKLAERTGISRSCVYLIESEKADAIALDIIKRIEAVLETELIDESCLVVCD